MHLNTYAPKPQSMALPSEKQRAREDVNSKADEFLAMLALVGDDACKHTSPVRARG